MSTRATTNSALLIGRQASDGHQTGLETSPEGVLGICDGSHAVTISAEARERLRASIIPNLLAYPGSVVVVDLSGEAYAATAQARRDMGQTVVRLDPFQVVDADTDALNPIDLLQAVEESAYEATCHDIAALIPGLEALTNVWGGNAFGLLAGVIGYLGVVPDKRDFGNIYNVLHQDDTVYALAVVLDTMGKKIPKMSHSEIAAWLQNNDADRSSILSALIASIKPLGTEAAQASLKASTVSASEIIKGKAITVYLTIPRDMLSTHSSLLNIWIGTLLRCARDRRFEPDVPMLFLLDEAASFSPFPQMQAAITSPAMRHARMWTFWQDVQEIRRTCPGSWVFENCGAIQAFGTKDFEASNELAATLGVEPETIQSLATYKQVISTKNGVYVINKLDSPNAMSAH